VRLDHHQNDPSGLSQRPSAHGKGFLGGSWAEHYRRHQNQTICGLVAVRLGIVSSIGADLLNRARRISNCEGTSVDRPETARVPPQSHGLTTLSKQLIKHRNFDLATYEHN
jgi:hypothetical protein